MRCIVTTLAGGSLLMATAAAAPGVISAGDFARRGEPYLSKSMVSLLLAKEPKQLMQQFADAAGRVRETQERDRAAGRPSATCLPPQGKARIDMRRFIGEIKTMPASIQAGPLDGAIVTWAHKHHPCRAAG